MRDPRCQLKRATVHIGDAGISADSAQARVADDRLTRAAVGERRGAGTGNDRSRESQNAGPVMANDRIGVGGGGALETGRRLRAIDGEVLRAGEEQTALGKGERE